MTELIRRTCKVCEHKPDPDSTICRVCKENLRWIEQKPLVDG